MAVRAELAGEEVFLFNLYAPTDPAERERYYGELASLQIPAESQLYVGGDFNCTQHSLQDRSHAPNAQIHVSAALQQVIRRWKLNDSLATSLQDSSDRQGLERFHNTHHTHTHSLHGGGLASSRLDRWYANDKARPWMARTEVDIYGVQSDHRGVLVHLRSPSDPIRVHKQARVFPLPDYARERGRLVVQGILAELSTQIDSGSVDAHAAAQLWDSTKARIVTSLLTAKRVARKSKKNTYRKKIKRMYRRLDRATAVARQANALGIQSVHSQATRERVAQLTQRIAETKREWMRSKSRRLFQSHAWREGKTTRKFFQRISNKFGDNIIPTLQPDSGPPATTPQAKADTMANAWRSVMQGAPAPAAAISSTTQWMAQGSSADTERFASGELITETTVGAALLACKPGKACGPDRLGNDWYREHAVLLIPILTKLYRLWYAAQVFPASFLEADIFSLKKSGDSSNPLNYRPLALLNTDYKILTRLLTTEIRKTLHHRISRFQNGFVPGRQIHATLHYLAAAQVMAGTSEGARDSLAILLDFAKAYDSLDRDYLYAVLKRHGYPDHFVAVIEKLHSGTSVRFLANGTRSHRIAVTRGIRQGCPLAPILFILALEPLYQRLERGLVHRGIALTTQAATAELRVAGYADDTAIYIREPAELAPVLTAVEDFGLASGLRLNRSKTVAIALHPDGLRLGAEWTADITLLATDELCRYLGVQVGSRPSAEKAWSLARKQLETRIRLASQKTLTVAQRASVAAAVIVPKLLHVGRHCWSSAETTTVLSKCIRNYVWHGQFVDHVANSKGWLAANITTLRGEEGGLSFPDLRAELMAMAAMMVSEWALSSSLVEHLVGDILFHDRSSRPAPMLFITPYHRGGRALSLSAGQNAWRAGVAMVHSAGLPEPSGEHERVVHELYDVVHEVLQSPLEWTDNKCSLNLMGLLGGETMAQRTTLRRSFGTPCLEWLPYAEIRYLFQCTLPSGHAGSALDSSMTTAGRLVRDVFTWEYVRNGRLILCKNPKVQEEQVRTLLLHLLAHYPEMAFTTPGGELRLHAVPTNHPLTVRVRPGSSRSAMLEFRVQSSPSTPTKPCHVTSTSEAVFALNTFAEPEVHVRNIHPHPALGRMVCLWSHRPLWRHTRRHYKQAVMATSRRHGQQNVQSRAHDWQQEHPLIAASLDTVSWQAIRKITGATAWGEQLLYRLKLRAFSQWDPTRDRVGCPIAECHSTAASPSPTFWLCPGAKRLWAVFYSSWRALGLVPSPVRDKATFQLALPAVPHHVWTVLDALHHHDTAQVKSEISGLVYDLLNQSWRLGVVVTLQAIWKRRCRYRDPREDPSVARAAALLHGRLRTAYMTIRWVAITPASTPHHAAAAKVCHLALTSPSPDSAALLPPTKTRTQSILYFDGGSRGNPGPGGSGSLIAKVGGANIAPVIEWMASVSYAKRTTNNIAEYQGLLVGLRYASRHRLHGLHVVGDSAMILTQLRQRKAPAARHLQGVYSQCRLLADRLQVSSWTHHLRQFNKAADRLANIAMDTKSSTQVFGDDLCRLPPLWTPVLELLQGDVTHWIDLHPDEEEDSRPSVQRGPV